MFKQSQTPTNKSTLALMLGAIGIVYGDIGTSPLYALKSCFAITNLPINHENIFGIISLFIWLLITVVYLKYIFIIMKCDQNDEGGVLILSSICKKINNNRLKKIATALGIAGVALFIGDSVITPAISVLSACEGLNLVIKIKEQHIVLVALIILFSLFMLQHKGSGNIGRYFGYIMLIWFITIGILGIKSIINNPIILNCFNPCEAIKFIIKNKFIGFVAIGGGILVISGVEALYADMGHFTKNPIKLSWSFIVFPSLTLNYLGQGSLLLSNPDAINNVFYLLAPKNFMYPMICLSLIATIIASQAVISGLFSLTQQAIMLNYLPRMTIKHTSFYQIGQIYIPAINYILLILTATAVIIFKNSSNLSFAYGLSVAGVMLISSILSSLIAYFHWKWSHLKMLSIFLPLFCLDILFVSSNLNKIFEGAWYTITIALASIYLIRVWRAGNNALRKQRENKAADLYQYLSSYNKKYNVRIPGCAIFLTRDIIKVPETLSIHLQHNKYLHEKIIFISIVTEDIAKVQFEHKFNCKRIFPDIYILESHFGFYEMPDLNKVISWAESQDIISPSEDISFFLSHGLPVIDQHHYLSKLSEKIYILMSNNALPAYEFFKVDYSKLVELGIMYKV